MPSQTDLSSNNPARLTQWISASAVVLSASLVMLATLPGRSYGLGLITTRLLSDFPGLTETRFGWINAIAAIIGAAACIPAGYLLDRFGTRRVLAVVILALAASVYAMTLSTSVMQLTVTLTLTRALGQSMLSVIGLAMMGKYFGKNASLSMGAFAVLMTMFIATAYDMIGKRIDASQDWRIAWSEIAWVLIALTPVILLTALRPRSPKRINQKTKNSKQTGDLEQDVQGATLNQALRTQYFWSFALSMGLFALATSGVTLLLQPILAERGISEATFRDAQMTGFFTGLFANLLGGYLMKHIAMHRLLAVAMLLLAAALASLAVLSRDWQAYAYAGVFGLSGGLITVLFFAVWVRAFGQRELGKIQGAAQLLTVLGSAFGPVVITQGLDMTDSYNPALIALSLAAILLGVYASITAIK
ncbi:MAG: MFS transporter [Phycisphaeraceae bacterium]|nr:MFS transporter [Phycisphaeraceae bacterium]